jgi:hypothetical protein
MDVGPVRIGRHSAKWGNSLLETAFRIAVIRKASYRSRFSADLPIADD